MTALAVEPSGLSFAALGAATGHAASPVKREVVCVQGLGMVGTALAVAVASARDGAGEPRFNVAGIDLPVGRGAIRIESLNRGRLDFASLDPDLERLLGEARRQGNLVATADPAAFGLASVVVIDTPIGLTDREGEAHAELGLFLDGLRTVAERVQPDTLVLVESTVPPGTCSVHVAPLLEQIFAKRGLSTGDLLLAHSYERVMPGSEHYDSVVSCPRVYAGHTEDAAHRCRDFLSRVLTSGATLTRLASTTASETAKVLENTFRAVNIALVDEWGRFAEAAQIDLFEVIDAIRQRPTHANLRQPGFGVGGFCLTKDPLMVEAACRQNLGLPHLEFPFARLAVQRNRDMPLATLEHLRRLLGGELLGRRLLLCGVTYRPGVEDVRCSPSRRLYAEAAAAGAAVVPHDPLVGHWPELDLGVERDLPAARGFDGVVFAVAHAEYTRLDLERWLDGSAPAMVDANNVLSRPQRDDLRRLGVPLACIGRG